MQKVFLIIIGLSLIGIIYSFSLSSYTDDQEFNEKYSALNWQEIGSRQASSIFYELRKEYLTAKYTIQDYSFTFLIIGFIGLLLSKYSFSVTAPKTKVKVFICGISAGLLTTFAYVADLFLQFFRGEFPWWADSLGIPLSGVPFMAGIFTALVVVSMVGVFGSYTAGTKIKMHNIWHSNYLYLLLIIFVSLVSTIFVLGGLFLFIIPGGLWIYFYLSLWAGRNVTFVTETT